MRIFVTAATGFVGCYPVPDLVAPGHQVVGLSRSDTGAESLAQSRAEVFRSDLSDLNGLRTAAENGDSVIQIAFNHDFSDTKEHSVMDAPHLARSHAPICRPNAAIARVQTAGEFALYSAVQDVPR